ncbi:hypothetical protein C8Q74DRAFT_1366536 [Fomes fomentarius]|nr:hypothetical protein C8Q74DRAFT_1366536 [Fomes fomentarius]
MATAARQSKPPRKGPDPARRPAWTGPRASPTFSPAPANARLPNGNQQPPSGAFPPLANGARANPSIPDPSHARILAQISGLTGTTVTISTKTNSRLEGVVLSTNAEGDTTGVTLKDVKEVSNPGAPLRETFFIAATNIQDWSSGPADAKIPNGADSFKTDTDISKTAGRRERELQVWQSDGTDSSAPPAAPSATKDEVTFGLGANGSSWDQFAVNEKLFGVKAGFDEDAYTTKLDRNAPDFKEKERKAAQIANEILNSAVNNVHVAEERVMNLTNDGSAVNEEDKYGAVVRGANAYVPPGARKSGAAVTTTTPPTKTEVPKVAVNAPDGTAVSTTTSSTPSASKVPSPAPSTSSTAKQPADAVPAFRNFVSTEKDRLLKKKQALMKSEMDKRLSDLVNFSKSFKLNKPIPEDLVPILAKDEGKQKAIKEKSTRDAEDARARAIGVSSTLTAPGARPAAAGSKGGADTARTAAVKSSGTSGTSNTMHKTATVPSKPSEQAKKISMVIQPIPPFKGRRSTTTPAAPVPQQAGAASAIANGAPKPAASPLSPTAQNRLNVNASSFRPNANVKPFSPGGSPNPNGASASSTGKQSENVSPQGPPNPFFGTRVIKKTPPVHVKDDFNPFKHHKVIEAAQVAPTWPYNGKRYMQMFPPIQVQPQQQSPPMAPPGPPPPMPPATYEEDPNAAAARGYVYAYPPYGYPGQMVPQMMPGMGPPPPGAYMPGPYMQPMPYHMPPPNAMYPSTPMGQMPPPQYMPPPPPGSYPPPPNGAGPRPSMPPTPIPSHAHPYYHHQSPQLQHAVPYPMMMPPPGPPHPYDPNAQPPPVQMGGHA